MSLRCCYIRKGDGIRFCAEIATKVRKGSDLRGDAFFCDLHALPTDRPIPIGQVFERERLSLVVDLAGVTPGGPVARSEAVERVVGVLERLGALVDVVRVESCKVQNRALPFPGRENVPDPHPT